MKKCTLAIICLSIIFVLSGCGKVNMGSNTVIKEDGSGRFTFKVVYDSIIASALKNKSILSADGNVLPKGEQVRRYMQGSDYAEDYTMDFNDINSLNQQFSNNKDMKVTIKEEKGLLHNTYTYEMSFPNGFKGTDVKTSTTDQETALNTNTKAANEYVNSVPFINEVTLPGKILSTNAIENSGNKLVWTYSLGQLTPDVAMTATYTLDNRTNIISLYIIAAIAVIGAIVSLVIIKKRKLV